MKKQYTIIFMGTPEFAVPTLNRLSKSHHHIALVVTQPDRTGGRGRTPIVSPVKSTALRLGYEILQPESMKTQDVSDRLRYHNPDLFVVIAFGHILSERLLSIPRLGAVNIHASLLPRYRGPAPIQWAIRNGETETGITTIRVDKGMDTGDILFSSKIPIYATDTAATLHDRLADLGATVLMKTLALFENNTINPMPQDHSLATYAPLLTKEDGRIDWRLTAQEIEMLIRAMTPWPGAFTYHGEKRLKILSAKPVTDETGHPPGVILNRFPDELRVATGKDALSIIELQAAGGKRMAIHDFLRGYTMHPGDMLL